MSSSSVGGAVEGAVLCGVRPIATISATVKASSAGVSWATTAVRLADSRGDSRTRSSPSTVMRPADGAQGAVDAAEQGGLAAAVRAEQADELAGADLEVGVLDDEAPVDAQAHAVDPQGHPRLRSSQRKNGTPKTAVTMLRASSCGAAMVRAATI